MTLSFCPNCGSLQSPDDPNRDCHNCEASMENPITGEFNDENAARLLEANFGTFVESDTDLD